MSELTDFEHYLRVTKKLADRSVSTYLFRVKLFLREYGEFSDESLIEWKENQIDGLKSANYINQGLISFKVYKQYKKLDVQIPKSVPSQKKQFVENVISRADYDYLCRYMIEHFHKTKDKKYERLYVAIRIMGTTGLRMHELLGVKVEDIKRGVFDIYGKRSKERRIYIPEKAKNELLNLLNYIGITSGFAIVDRSGKRYKTRAFQSILQSLAEETKIDKDLMHPHGFRHFFAKEFIRNHNDICLLADLLGHSNLETTRMYLKMTSREQSEIVNKIVDW
jgi:site-specific recombinase XerD